MIHLNKAGSYTNRQIYDSPASRRNNIAFGESASSAIPVYIPYEETGRIHAQVPATKLVGQKVPPKQELIGLMEANNFRGEINANKVGGGIVQDLMPRELATRIELPKNNGLFAILRKLFGRTPKP